MLTEGRGGGGVHAADLAAAASARGDAVVTVVTGAPDRARRGGAARLARLAAHADVVHCHGVRAALVTPPVRRGRMVVTTHGLHASRGTRGPRAPFARALTAGALARAHAVVCVSEDDAAEVRRVAGRVARRSVTIPNGVAPRPVASGPERAEARDGLDLPADAPVLLFVGSLIPQKNPELALEAADRARRGVPGLVLLMAGEGPLRQAVRGRAGAGTLVLGARPDVGALLAASDALLNTSRWEGMSLAILEALWRGRPAIATDAPGNREAVGDVGLVVAADAGALAEAIARAFMEEGLLADLSERARRRAEARFDVADMTRETLALYDRIAR